MYKNLSTEHSISLLSANVVEEFQQIANEQHTLSALIGNHERDLFIWRLALDLYYLIGKRQLKDKFIFVPERAIISPLQYFILNSITKSEPFNRLPYMRGKFHYERFLLSVYIAVGIKKWTYSILDGDKDYLNQIVLTGDLFGFVHHATVALDHLPFNLLEMQAQVIKKLRNSPHQEYLLLEEVAFAIEKAKKLSHFLQLTAEECIGWKVIQLQ